jgi:hypothetical protein
LSKNIDIIIRATDAGYELRYLPQATEEDRGALLFKARAGIGVARKKIGRRFPQTVRVFDSAIPRSSYDSKTGV